MWAIETNNLMFIDESGTNLQQIPIKPATKEPTEKAQSRCHNDETN
jgi:hypothetical protein